MIALMLIFLMPFLFCTLFLVSIGLGLLVFTWKLFFKLFAWGLGLGVMLCMFGALFMGGGLFFLIL